MNGAHAAVTASPAPRLVVPSTQRPDVSFVYVTFGTGAAMIDESLQRLVSSIGAAGIGAEVIVVDNLHPVRAHDTADHIARVTSGVLVIRASANLGFGGGNELGIAHARAERICLLNPDLMVHDRWLAPMLDTLAANPVGIVAPRFVRRDGSPLDAGHIVDTSGLTRPAGAEDPSDYSSAACWLFERSWHDRTGGFDPRFHPAYFEDVDAAFRSHRLGGPTTIAPVEVVHDHGTAAPGATIDASHQHEMLQLLWRDDLRHFTDERADGISPIAMTSSSIVPQVEIA